MGAVVQVVQATGGAGGTPSPGIDSLAKPGASVRGVDSEHARLRVAVAAAAGRSGGGGGGGGAGGAGGAGGSKKSLPSSSAAAAAVGSGAAAEVTAAAAAAAAAAVAAKAATKASAAADTFHPWPRIVHVVNLFEHAGMSKVSGGVHVAMELEFVKRAFAEALEYSRLHGRGSPLYTTHPLLSHISSQSLRYYELLFTCNISNYLC